MKMKKLIRKGKITAASAITALDAPANPALTKADLERAYLALKKHGALNKDGGAVVMIPYAEYLRLVGPTFVVTTYREYAKLADGQDASIVVISYAEYHRLLEEAEKRTDDNYDNTISDFLREEAERLSKIPESAFESTIKDGVEMFRFKPMEPRDPI